MVDYMRVATSPSSRTLCKQCDKQIFAGTLRVSPKSYKSTNCYFHLRCYRPQEPCPVDFDNDVDLGEKEQDIGRVKTWVDKWNRRFIIDERKVPAQRVSISATGNAHTPLRRLLLEVS